MTDLDPKLTFDTFVVGPANRLASAAARRAADAPGSSYNPLFMYAPSGLGKSHLLVAIAHHAGRRSDVPVLYRTLEELLEDLTAALAAGDPEGLRERYRRLGLLLLDDVQFLEGQAEAQEMLLRILDGLTASGGQIVLASDRPPADIDKLDARLLSRFAGGLIVDIAPPEFETRVAIVRRKAEERGQRLQPGVAEGLARHPFRNVRELGGGLNRVLAVQELEGRTVTAADLPELLGEPARGEGVSSELAGLLSEISGVLDTGTEDPWRQAVREAAEAAEVDGFNAGRMRALLRERHAPGDWEDRLVRFGNDVDRLREIDQELDRLGNPWPEAAASVVKDPDRLEEAEALLASVRERVRPFLRLGPGPDLEELSPHFPQLPMRAAEQLVTAPRPKYNPLFLWSQPGGSSARAILAATGRTYQAANAEGRMAVTSAADFAEDFIRGLSEGVAGAWRERWWTVDVLLIHGLEELTDTERAQDEFFHLFEALKRRGSRVLLVADRPPARIERIDERLRSRFEGGLVLEAPARGLPEGADRVELVEPGAEGGEELWTSLVLQDEPVTVPGVEVGPPTARPNVTPPVGGASGAGADGAWRPSRERVVWVWPQVQDRLVEELD